MPRMPRAVAVAALTLAATAALSGCSGTAAPSGPPSGGASSGSPSGSTSPAGTGRSTEPGSPGPSPSSSPEPSATRSATPSPEPSATRSATPSPTSTPSGSPSASSSASPSPRPRTTLVIGDSGARVLALQQRLSELGYWLGAQDGSFGPLTQQAVLALQKAAGISRDGVVGPNTRRALDDGVRPPATVKGDGLEVDLGRQLLLVVRGGAPVIVLNTSTGSGEEYTSTFGNPAIARTPTGTFTFLRRVDGMAESSLGTLWRPIFFTSSGYAVHGSQNVPPWPASHGCVRVSNAAIDMIWARGLAPVGSTVTVR